MKNFQNMKQLGSLGELKVASRLLELGYKIYFPFGDNSTSDLIYENEEGKLKKVQVKSSSAYKDGAVLFSLRSCMRNYIKRYSENDVDEFALYNEKLDEIYLIPYVNKRSVTIRCEPPKNNKKGCLYNTQVML